MTAEYTVRFSEPWNGVVMRGSFKRWVKDEAEAIQYQINYEMKYKKLYNDEFATVGLVSMY